MKKRFPALVLALVFCLSLLSMGEVAYAANPSPENDFQFDASTGTITGYVGSGGDVVIPDTIGGMSVTAIGESAFNYCSSLTSVTIPNSVTSIGAHAFDNCSSLTSVNIPDGVTSIGIGTFGSCSSLTSVTIPEGVTSIGTYAFWGASSLTEITIPAKVESIGVGAFFNCTSLNTVTFLGKPSAISDYNPYPSFGNVGGTNPCVLNLSEDWTAVDKETMGGSCITAFSWYGGTFLLSHDIKYEVSDAAPRVLTATCKSCSQSVSLTLIAEGGIYDSTAFPASFNSGEADEWKDFLGNDSVPMIQYVKDGETEKTDSAPREAGTYTAQITAGAGDAARTAKVTFTIEKQEITVSGIAAKDKKYDGSKTAELDLADVILEGMIDGDDLTVNATGTFADEKVGADKVVSLSNLTLCGEDAGNYKLKTTGQQETAIATITCSALDQTSAGHNWSDGKCTFCGLECSHGDDDQDHFCDYCDLQVSECVDANKDHLCDICDVRLSDCVDKNKDHLCDLCGVKISDCVDNNKDHLCDTCGDKLSDCTDENKDHICDYCEEVVSNHNGVLVDGVAATIQSAGYKSYYKCECGKFFEDEACKVEIIDLDAWKSKGGNGYIAPLEDYQIIAGMFGEWIQGKSEGLAFTSDASFDKFESVKIDGSVISKNNYTAEKGSTKITLVPAYLETLSNGSHSIEIVSKDGSASSTFTIKAAPKPPVPASYIVSFEMNGHGDQVTAQTVEKGNKAAKPSDPTAKDWTFSGWYADSAFSAAFDFEGSIEANTTVYAKWTKNADADPKTPQTGDNSYMFLWIALLFVSGGALVGTAIYGRKNRTE